MGSRRARMIRATAFFLLLLQAASTHQAAVPTDANLVLTEAAESLESVLGLDYNVLEPTFRDIDLVKENLVELMPYLEESERPVITTAYANLLDLEGTLSVDFGTTLGLLTDKATRYSQQMQGKIARYPKKFKSSLRTLNTFLATVSENTNGLVEASDNALRQAKVVLISVEAFKNMMKVAEPKKTRAQPFKSFLDFSDIFQTIAFGVTSDTTSNEALALVKTLIPKVVDLGVGFNEIKETPNLRARVDQTIKIMGNIVKKIRNISSELRNANDNIKTNSLSVQHLKENSEAYNIENMKIEMLNGKFAAVFDGGENVGKTVATVTDYKPKVFEIPPSRATTTTTTTTISTTTTTTTRASTSTTTASIVSTTDAVTTTGNTI